MLDFFSRPAPDLALALLGCRLVHHGPEGTTAAIIVETEAYDRHDPASHSYRGLTKRNKAMFGPPGHAYVYLCYGVHWCFNVTAGQGAAVLIRAARPQEGVALMRQRSAAGATHTLCQGPGKLSKAMGITKQHDGLPLGGDTLVLEPAKAILSSGVAVSPRIGIRQACEVLWRFYIEGDPCVSKSRPAKPRHAAQPKKPLPTSR